MKLSEAIVRFRQHCNLTQKQAAFIANVTERNFQRYEHDLATPSAKVIIDLAKSTGISADFILGLSDNPNLLK